MAEAHGQAMQAGDAARFGAAVHAYVRAVAGAVSDVLRVGPFTVLLSPTSKDAPWNYAIPDDGATPSTRELDALAAAFTSRGLEPRVEMVPDAVPESGPALLRHGFRLVTQLPLMACEPHSWVDLRPPTGIAMCEPSTTEELRAMAQLQHEVFADPAPVTDAFVERRREVRDIGGVLRIAKDEQGAVVGAGMCPPQHLQMREIVGIATVPEQRRRGIASAVTSELARSAFASGCVYVFLEAERGADGAYRRAGFRSLASVAHYAR